MSRLINIGVDIDEVLYDFVGGLRDWLVLQGGHPDAYPEPTRWDFAGEWGLHHGEFTAAIDEAVDQGFLFRVGAPYPGVEYALHQLTKVGRVHLVTNRHHGKGDAARQNTLAWLAQYRLPYDSLTFTDDKAGKGPRCDIYIDDRPENYDALNAAGMEAWLRTQPWNLHRQDAWRVPDISEFVVLAESFAAFQPREKEQVA